MLLHACCAPCSIGAVKYWCLNNMDVRLYFDNPNIHPTSEYLQRRDALRVWAKEAQLQLDEAAEPGFRSFFTAVVGNDAWEKPQRCALCYELRLRKAAEFALTNAESSFSTTLLISPYQDHELLRVIGERIAAEYSLAFAYGDLRPYYREAQAIAKELGLYRQRYCGCLCSEAEALANRSLS